MTGTRLLPNVIAALLLAPILAYASFAVAPGAAGFVVTSGSMAPAIGAGSIVYVADTGNYERGDVISFHRGDSVVTHRVIAVTEDGYRTAGDANDRPDGRPVPDDRVVGEVLLSVPLYGFLLAFATTPHGYLGLVLAPGLLLVGLELRDLVTESG